MPDAIITSTASTFGTISGVFSADQSTISGTISGVVPGTLTGSVGVPGPAGAPGIGLPAGGTSGQFLQKTSGVDYATDWVTVNLTGLATESWVTAGFYPLTGNPSGFLTSASLSGYATETFVTSQGYITSSALTPYLTKADNLASVASPSTARDNLGLGSLSTPTFAGVNVPGSGTSVANLGATSLTINQQGSGQFTIQPSQGIVFPNGSIQTTAFTGVPADYITSVSSPLTVTTGNLSIDLSAYLTSATAASTYQTLSGMSSYLTTSAAASTYQTLAGMSDYLAKAGNLAGLANTGTARTNLGLGSLAVVNDAPSDGSQYARRNAAWEVVSSTSPYITSVSSPLSVTSGNLTIDLSAYAQLSGATFTGNVFAPTPSPGTDSTRIATTEWVKDFDYAPTNSPHFTGNPKSVTPSTGDDDTSIATTAFVKAQNYITSAALSGYATESWVTSQGYLPASTASFTYAALTGATFTGSVNLSSLGVTFFDATTQTTAGISPATAASTYYPLTGNPSSFLVAADITGKANLASPALTGNVTITTNSTSPALVIVQDGTGDVVQFKDVTSDTSYSFINASGKVTTIPSTTANAGFNIPHGTAPTSPVNGDVWTTTAGLFYRINSSTKTTATLQDSQNFTGLNINLGTNTGTGTIGLATGATLSGSTKTVNIGTAGVAGSTTNIAIGSTTGTSTTTLQGITNGVTQTAGDSSLKLATTAFVTTADNLKANLASPALSGTPTAPTATLGTNTTQIATTAFVLANGSTTYATEAQLLAGTSTTTAINPSLLRTAMSNAGYTTYSSMIGNYSTYQSGAAGLSIYSDYVSVYVNTANGKIAFSPSSAIGVNSLQGRGTDELVINWAKPMWFSYRFHYGAAIGSNANTVCRVTIGKTASTFGDLSSRGFGIKWDGSTTGLFTVMAHNGTTLSNVASSVSVSTTTYFPTNTSSADFLVYSDGAGNVTLYCNNVQIATTTGGPSSGTGAARFIFETDNTTSTTGLCAPAYMGIRSFFAY